MNPTPGQIQSIKSFVAGLVGVWSNTDAQIRAAMAGTKVNNPVATAPTVPKPFTLAQLLGSLSAASQANLNSVPGMGQLILDIRANDVAACTNWIAFLESTAKITAAEGSALQAIVSATEADPSWTAQVSWDVANIRPSGVDDFDLEAARHS
jgi:hypothetical protein